MDYAWFSLTRLCGCNYKQPILAEKGKSLIVADPQDKSRTYRISKADFEADKFIIRSNWAIKRWSDEAARICKSEENWQV